MKIHRRRVLAALGTAVAVAAGMAGAPDAVATGPVKWDAKDGVLAFRDGADHSLRFVKPGSGTYTTIATQASQPAWSPDGSRVAYVRGGRVETRRYTGSTLVKIPEKSSSVGSASDPTFVAGGSIVVYSASGRLRWAETDGSRYAQPLFSTAEDGCDRQPSGAANSLIAFVRTGDTCGSPTGSAVWLYDAGTQGFTKLADSGSHPAMSPDGTRVAFVRTVDSVGELFVINVDGTGERRLTTGAHATAPEWAPSGSKIVFNTGTDNSASTRVLDLADDSVSTLPMPGHSAATLDLAWQPLRGQSVGRVWGADSAGTNLAASRWSWNTLGQSSKGLLNAKAAVLINQDSPSYALTAQSLGGQKQGPVLVTAKSSLSSAAQAELKRTLKPGATVYLIGGTSVLSSAVSAKVGSLGFTPKRLSGTSRYSTSVAVAKAVTSKPEYVFLATGTDYHSAIAASAAAGALGYGGKGTVVLNDGNSLSSSVKSYLNSLNPDKTMVVPVGASARYALTHTSFSKWPGTYTYYPVSGSGHDGTSVELARFWWAAPSQVGLASTDSWRGGVTASSGMLQYGPILWSDATKLTDTDANYLRQQAAGVGVVFAFGGTSSISSAELTAAGSAISAGSSLVTYYPYYKGLDPAPQKSALSAPAGGSTGRVTGPAAPSAETGPAAPGRSAAVAPRPDLASVATTNK
ncbi:cell wall-binding repeat-containing protein [Streptomyces sp. NPDC007084]|uniref:cell wall-binding repeat-containing protein n=1 Tax=Streptomyces sp. NPDC007084 TaxID=3154313 RepID=UPI00345408F0